MLEFATNYDAPVTVKIGGVEYSVPKMYNDDWQVSHAEQMNKRMAEAIKGLDEEQTARFKAIWEPTPRDSETHLKWALSPEGVVWILKRQLAKATPAMPEAIVESTATKAPLRSRRTLVVMLTEAPDIIKDITNQHTDEGEQPSDPLAKSAGA